MARGTALSRRRRNQAWSARLNTVVCASDAAMMLVLTHHATVTCVRALKLYTRRALAGAVGDAVSSWLGNSSLTEAVVNCVKLIPLLARPVVVERGLGSRRVGGDWAITGGSACAPCGPTR